MPRYHNHGPLRRTPDFWDDVQDTWKDLIGAGSDNGGNGDRTKTSTIKSKTTSQANTRQGGATTIVKTVYKTQTPTFTDPIGGWSTQLDEADKTSAPPAKTTEAKGAPLAGTTSTLPASIEHPLTESIPTTLVAVTDTPTLPGAATTQSRATAGGITNGPNPTAQSSTENLAASSEPSGAAKAGIAIGVLAGVLVIFLVIFFAFNRRRKQVERERLEDEDEKINGPFGAAAAMSTTPTNPHAPRISLRPVTQFLPNWNLDKRASRSANIVPAAAVGAAGAARGYGHSAWERPSTSQSENPANPFGFQAERLHTPIAEEPSNYRPYEPVSPISPIDKPLPDIGMNQDPYTANGPVIAAGAAAAGASMAGAGLLTRKASIRKDVPRALDLTLPPPLSVVPASPAGTEFSFNSVSPGQAPEPSAGAAAIVAAGGPAGSTVHRVQLDFKPTLEDEMGLRAGQLVRLLHEYDDGWALCIRLDRSQQGVVPRTCLSSRPVKPRPQNGGPRGPPVNPNAGPRGPNYPSGQRPMTPQGGPPYPVSESPMRPMTAPGRPASPAGRPMSPAGGRSMSPGPRSQSPGPRYQGPPGQRPQSPSGVARKPSPPGPSKIPQPSRMNPSGAPPQYRPGPPTGPVGRKPVPGQAY